MFSEGSSTIDDIFASDDEVVVRITQRGTYIGEPRSKMAEGSDCVALRVDRRPTEVRREQ